jgi:glyoxylase-like metal-dependent hydrolase (beta-lactamase superfamily II)
VPATFTTGPFECRLISDGGGFLPVEVMFATAREDERAAALGDRLEPEGRVAVPYGCLLVRNADTVVLVDTGIGAYEHLFGGHGGELDAALGAAGLSPADVQIVVVTHGHPDHLGGLCTDGRPRFAAARYLISQDEWDWLAEGENPIAREQLGPVEEAGRLERVDGETELVPGLRLVPAPGHTPGQLAIEIGGPPGVLYLADVVADELHVEHPGWVMAFDRDPERNVRTRAALLGRAADEELVVAAAHIPQPGRIEHGDSGLRFAPLRSEV